MTKSIAAWFEIPVSDLGKAKTFYSTVLSTSFDDQDTGPNPVSFFASSDMENGTGGHLYPGKPAQRGTGSTIHLNVPDTIEDCCKRVEEAGGTVVTPAIEIPVGRFAYCEDLDGNSFALFEGK